MGDLKEQKDKIISLIQGMKVGKVKVYGQNKEMWLRMKMIKMTAKIAIRNAILDKVIAKINEHF